MAADLIDGKAFAETLRGRVAELAGSFDEPPSSSPPHPTATIATASATRTPTSLNLFIPTLS